MGTQPNVLSPSKNDFSTLVLKNNAKADIKIFRCCITLFDFLRFPQIFCQGQQCLDCQHTKLTSKYPYMIRYYIYFIFIYLFIFFLSDMTVKLIQIGSMPFSLFPVIDHLPVYRAIKNFVILKETLKAFDDFKNKQKSE